MQAVLAAFGLFLFTAHVVADDTVTLKHKYLANNTKTHLEGNYTMKWDIDHDNNLFYLALIVKTDGWVGFGIAERAAGAMAGADMLIGWVDDSGTGHVEDRYSLAFRKPDLDKRQDWHLVSSSAKAGQTVIEAKRFLKTYDGQDRDITIGLMRFVVAYGDKDDLMYHGPHRIGFGMSFIVDPTLSNIDPPETDLKHFDIRFNKTEVPGRRTNYFCVSRELPDMPPHGAHIVKFETIEDTPELVHHLVLYACPMTGPSKEFDKYQTPGICHVMHECSANVWAWGLHGEPLIFPPDAGILFGTDNPASLPRRLVLQLHWDNEALKKGIHDSSGVRITYTQQLRKHNAGSMRFGDGAISLPPMQPKQPYVPFDMICPSECTQEWKQPVELVATLLHMHETGTRMFASLHRANGTIEEIDRIDYYFFDNQNAHPIRKTINPGDEIHTHCVYDTTKLDKPMIFGPSETDEMCILFAWYYPAMVNSLGHLYSVCEFDNREYDGLVWRTQCGNKGDVQDLKMIQNGPPAKRDNLGCHTMAFGGTKPMPQPVCAHDFNRQELSDGAIDVLANYAEPCSLWECNGGKCKTSRNSFIRQYCECPDGYSGEHCETIEQAISQGCNCKNGGKCNTKFGVAMCICKEGFHGDHCEKTGAAPMQPNGCSPFGLIQCIALPPKEPNDECAQSRHIAKCAMAAKCSGMLSLWCDTLWKWNFGCGIPECNPNGGLAPACQPTVFRQCFASVVGGDKTDACDRNYAFHQCGELSGCHDINKITCVTKRKAFASCSTLTKSCTPYLASSSTMQEQIAEIPQEATFLSDLVHPDGVQSASGETAYAGVVVGGVVALVVGVIVVVAVAIVKRRRQGDAPYELMVA